MTSDAENIIDWRNIEAHKGPEAVQIAKNFLKWTNEINITAPDNFNTRYLNGEPIQYILGVGFFHNYHFKLNSSTLIPRPETEELVELILSENRSLNKATVLDIGTGCGCIPITLMLEKNTWQSVGIDIQESALKCALENSQIFNIESRMKFELVDILTEIPQFNAEIWVSNPPYIPNSEIQSIEDQVRNFEPQIALFVDDPLIFYRRIIQLFNSDSSAQQLWFECHQDFVSEVAALANKVNLKAKKIGDCSGNLRFILINK